MLKQTAWSRMHTKHTKAGVPCLSPFSFEIGDFVIKDKSAERSLGLVAVLEET